LGQALIDPRVKLVEQRQRLALPQSQTLGSLHVSLLGALLDLVDVGDELEGKRGPEVSAEIGAMEASTHMHHAAQASLRRHKNSRGAVLTDKRSAVPFVIVALDEAVDASYPWLDV